MWYLTSESDQRVLYVLPNKELTIGRSVDAQVCNFAIPDDPSISRRHATLSISGDRLCLQDLGSRYGTFINGSNEKLDSALKINLNNNDVIKFGKMGSVWKIHEIHFVTCTSTLKGENLQNLKLCLGKVGAVLKNEWDESCTYLTMPAITLTIKVVLALADGSHIVSPEFWTKCLEAVDNQVMLPSPSDFVPQIIESTLNKEKVSFLPNEKRKTLFAGKTFIFFSRKQLDMYKTVLMKCSATPLLLSETKMTKSALCEQNVIVIQFNVSNVTQETQGQKTQIDDIVNYLKTKGKRVVTDAEIGLAILYCSTVKFCNSEFNFPSEVIKQTSNQNPKTANILAQESQEPQVPCKNENVVINESLMSTNSNYKRKFSEDENNESNLHKKLATGVTSATFHNEGAKRKFTDDTNDVNPNKKMALDNEDDNFNFVSSSSKDNNVPEKKLNFSKPQKRKTDITSNEEENLFNFVQDQSKSDDKTANSIFNTNRSNDESDVIDTNQIKSRKLNEDEKVDISVLRGARLKELMENNLKWDSDTLIKNVKKEESDDIDKKLQDLNLGTTIITIRKDLIKKEPIQIHESDQHQNGMKNFKKFKKVWPVKVQVTVIPKSSSNGVNTNTSITEQINSMTY